MGAVPSAYAHASAGTEAASAKGNRSAQIAATISRDAYARSAVDRPQRPASHAPSARPPMNAASTVLAAATVCPS